MTQQFRSQYITSTSDLVAFCARAAHEPFIAMDTEFVRERTYYPELSLIQIASSNEVVLIDPLAEGIDLQPLWQLMQHESLIKVFHAARQDMEIFLHHAKALPTHLFDTQTAAMFLGMGESISYRQLVQDFLDKDLDKSCQYTNWKKRPLSDKQLTYAAADVTYLRSIYQQLRDRLEQEQRLAWFLEEQQRIMQPNHYILPKEQAWQRLRIGHLKAQDYPYLYHLAAFRENWCQEQDVPRGRACKDHNLIDIVKRKPRTVKALQAMRMPGQFFTDKILGEQIVALCTKTHEPLDTALQLQMAQAAEKESLVETMPLIYDAIKLFLKTIATQYRISEQLLYSASDILWMLHHPELRDSLYVGWREAFMGDLLNDFLAGKRTLQIQDEKVILR